MSSTEHADLEALSAFVDGEAPEWADHVAGCEACRASAAQLGAVAAALRAPVDPPAEAVRERAVAAALEASAPEASAPEAVSFEAERERFARRRSPRHSWAMPAAAAVVVALLGLSGVILSSNRSADESTTLAGPAPEADRGVAAAAPNVPPADLGDITDPSTLRMRSGFPVQSLAQTGSAAAGDTGATTSSGRAISVANSGAVADSGARAGTGESAPTTGSTSAATGSAGGSAVVGGAGGTGGAANLGVTPPTTTLNQRSPTPVPVGTRPCEEQARAREPNLGPVTYFATARRGDVPAYVLGFGAPTQSVTLLLLAQNGCGELLRSAGP